MNALWPLFVGISWRATWLMLGALVIAFVLQRRRPLAASSVLRATLVALLAFPVLFATLPDLPVAVTLPPVQLAEGDAGTVSPPPAVETTMPIGLSGRDHGESPGQEAWSHRQPAIDRIQSSDSVGLSKTAGSPDTTPHHQGSEQVSRISTKVPPLPQTGSFRWPLLLSLVYLTGVVFLGVRLAGAFRAVHRLRQSAGSVEGEWLDRLILWQRSLGVTRHVELLRSEEIHVPLTVGCRKPAILLPESILESPQANQDAVLLHELAHIRRHDFLDAVLLQATQMLYWCHPLVWVIGLAGRHLRERACDDVCIYWMGAPETYRSALLAIARQTICTPRLAIGLAILHTSRLSQRVAHIEQSAGSRRCLPTVAARLLVYSAVLAVGVLTVVVQFVPREAVAEVAARRSQAAFNRQNASANAPQEATANAVATDRQDGAIVAATGLAQPQSEPISTYEKIQAAVENLGRFPEPLVASFGSSRLRHWSYVHAVVWNPDGSLLGSIGGDGCLRLWNPDTGEQVKRFKSEPAWPYGAPHLTSLAFEPTGQRVAVGMGTNAVRVWDIATGAETHFLKDDVEVLKVAWHPTQPLVATSGEVLARLWDLSTGKIVRTLEPQDKSFKRQYTTDAVQVAFTPDGRHVLVGHPDGSIRYWNVDTGEVTRTIKAHDVAVQAMAIDARRDWLASGGREGKLRLWQLSTGTALREIQAHKEYLQGLSFHPRQDTIYSGGLDGLIRNWNARSGDKIFEFAGSRNIGPSAVAIHPSRELIASAGYAIRLWDAATGKPHIEFPGHLGGLQALKFSPDGSRLITAGNDATVRVWDARSRQQLTSYEFDSPAAALDLTADGKSFATISLHRGNVDIRSLDDGQVLSSFQSDGQLSEAVSLSPNGKWLAATAYDRGEQGLLTLWNLSTNALHGRIQTSRGRAYFSPDGTRLLVVGSEFRLGTGQKSRLAVWDVESLKNTLAIPDVQGLGGIGASTLSADGTTLVLVGTTFDKNQKSHDQLVFWDWTKNETRLVVEMQDHHPNNIAIAPNGQTVFTAASLQGEARIWDVRDGTLRQTIKLCAGGHWAIGPAAFTADSSQVAVAMGNGTIYVIDAQKPPLDVATKVSVPPPAEEAQPDPWKALIGQPAPEFQAEGWLFGDPTTTQALRGKWVVLYFWTSAYSEQDMPAWMDMQQRLGEKAPTVIVVSPDFGASLESQRKFFDLNSSEWWGGRTLPFRVLVDKRRPNVIFGTEIETGGATFAAYRVLNAWRGYRPNSLALLVGPDGLVKQRLPSRPTVRELEKLMEVTAVRPKWESELLQAYTLPAGENLRRFAAPYSQAREDYRFFHHGQSQATMTFAQGDALRPGWTTFSSETTLEFVLDAVLGFKSYEVVDPEKILQRKVAGDWSSRTGTPREELLRVLEKIAADELGWKLRFERTTVTQPVVVATGRWQQTALPGVENQKSIYWTIDDVPDGGHGGGGSGSLDELFASLGDRIQVRFVNEVTDPPTDRFSWQDRLASHLQEIREHTPEGQAELTRLLHNLTRQTGVTLKTEERDVVVWRVVAK